jgi:hypothetical protein
MSRQPHSIPQLLRAASLPFVLGMLIAIACWIACGINLGLFFGGIALTIILLPPLAMRADRPVYALLATVSVVDGVGIVWLIAVLMKLTLLQWLQAYMVLAVVALAVLGMVMSLRRVIGAAAAAGTTIVFLAWLSWPVWLSPWADARLVAMLAPVHPLFALNRVLVDLGIWTQQPVMYQLTSLGQDVPYELPASTGACVLAHLLMGLTLGLPAWWWSVPEELAEHRSAASPAP